MSSTSSIGLKVLPAQNLCEPTVGCLSHLKVARGLLQAGRLDEAEIEFRAALASGADEVATHAGLAEIARRRGDRPAAVALLTAVVQRYPTATRLAVQLAEDLRRLGRTHEAEARISGLIEAGLDSEQVRLVAGRLAEARGDAKSAMDEYRRATNLRPDRAPAFLRLGVLLLAAKRLAEAEQALERAVALAPREGTAYAALAELAGKMGHRAKAIGHLKTALVCLPQDARLRLKLANELYRAGDHRLATRCLNQLPEEARRREAALLLEGRLAEAGGDLSAAERAYAAAKAVAPASIGAEIEHALVLWRLGRCADAEAALRALRERHPRSTEAALALARVLAEAERLDEAEKMAGEVIRLDHRATNASILRSNIVGKLSSMREAAEVLRAAAQSTGADLKLLMAECHLQFDRGLDAAGEARLAEAERLRPQDFAVRKLRVVRMIAVSPREDVCAALNTLPCETVAEKAEHDLLLGKLEASRLRFHKAEVALRAVLTAYPRHAGAMHLLARTQLATLQVFEARQSLARLNNINRGMLAAKGRSPNVSQGLIGEILNDFWSDAGALDATRSAFASGDLAGVLDVVRENPGYTGAAISLMNLLRSLGALEDGAVDVRGRGGWSKGVIGAGAIPRCIFQFWDSAEPPEDVSELMESWREHNPGWCYRRFNLAEAREYLAAHATVDVQRAFRSARHVAQKSDIFRLAVLASEGGVYTDADDRCMGCLDALIEGRELVLRQEHLGSIGNNFIAVRRGHPLIAKALAAAVTAVLRGDSESMWLSTGPGLLTRSLAGALSEETGDLSKYLSAARILLDWQLKPYCTSGCRASYKSSPRHWVIREFANAG